MSNERTYAGRCHIYGQNHVTRMLLLVVSLFGLQFVWGTEQVYFMNYMVSIGMPKSWISLVWLAGPLSGLVVQPVVGAYSDLCQSTYGRRRPFLAIGCAITVLCLFVVGFAHDILILCFNESLAIPLTITLVILAVFALDFAVNAVQAVGRAIIVDSLPTEQQEEGNAWASRVVAVGHLLAYILGYVDLKRPFHFLADSQFKIVIIFSNLALLVSVAITCRSVEERILVDRGTTKSLSIRTILKSIWTTFITLPPRIRLICYIQVLVWHAWFPFLFYSSTWVGEVYAAENSNLDINADDRSRRGALAMSFFSCVTLVTAFLAPKFLVQDPKDDVKSSYRVTLPRLWALSHLAFGGSMIATTFITNTAMAMCVIASCGFSWAVMSWAPFSMIGEEITKATARSRRNSNITIQMRTHDTPQVRPPDDEDSDLDIEASDNLLSMAPSAVATSNDDTGSILGIHNIALCIPQFVISFIASAIFRLMESGSSTTGQMKSEGQNAIGVIFGLAGLFALAAGIVACKKL